MGKATRDAYGETLKRLGSTHPDIIVLDADLSESTKTSIFAKKFPDRFFDTGIAEENMMGIAEAWQRQERFRLLPPLPYSVQAEPTNRLEIPYVIRI